MNSILKIEKKVFLNIILYLIASKNFLSMKSKTILIIKAECKINSTLKKFCGLSTKN